MENTKIIFDLWYVFQNKIYTPENTTYSSSVEKIKVIRDGVRVLGNMETDIINVRPETLYVLDSFEKMNGDIRWFVRPNNKNHYKPSGNFVFSFSSDFPFDYPIPVYDRIEK